MNYENTLMRKEIFESVNALENIKTNDNVIKRLTAEIVRKKIQIIYAVGRGTSDNALNYFRYVTEIYCGIPVCLGAPSIVTLYGAKINFNKALVIGCSQSGKSRDIIEVLKRANEQGGISVCVTNDCNSELSKISKYTLNCCAGEEKSVPATKTFNAQVFVLLKLALSLANIDEDNFLQKFINQSPDILNHVETLSDALLNELTDIENGFILSRGICYSIAQEFSLKVAETSYVNLRSYASSDFYHGPMALVKEKSKVFIFSPKLYSKNEWSDLREREEEKIIEKCVELKAEVIVITNNEELKKFDDQVKIVNLENCDFPEYLSAIAFAFFLQIFTCKLACKKGYHNVVKYKNVKNLSIE